MSKLLMVLVLGMLSGCGEKPGTNETFYKIYEQEWQCTKDHSLDVEVHHVKTGNHWEHYTICDQWTRKVQTTDTEE